MSILTDRMISAAQNDEMVDTGYTHTGQLLIEGAKEIERLGWNLYEAYSDGYISKYIFDRIIHADMKNERKEQGVLRKKLRLYKEYARLLDEDRTALLEDESGGDILLHTKRIGEIVDELNGLLLKDKTQ